MIDKLILKDIYNKGTNIYQILTIWRNKYKVDIPDPVLEVVCRTFLKRMNAIPKKKHWIYIHSAINKAISQFNAKKNIDESEIWKTGETIHTSLRETLLRSLGEVNGKDIS